MLYKLYAEAMMRSYCNAVGIDFLDSMINWTDDPTQTLVGNFGGTIRQVQ